MFGLRNLFYPWGFLVQIVALVHFVRRRPDGYWLYIILFGGFLGAAHTSWWKCCRTRDFFAAFSRDSGVDRAFRLWNCRLSTILRLGITRNWASSTWSRNNCEGARRV